MPGAKEASCVAEAAEWKTEGVIVESESPARDLEVRPSGECKGELGVSGRRQTSASQEWAGVEASLSGVELLG